MGCQKTGGNPSRIENKVIGFTHMRTPLNRYTFKNKRLKEWVEDRCFGSVLNLFAGKTLLNVDETRVDSDPSMNSDYHMDALEFCRLPRYDKFDTVVLDPPYAYRKSMEMYNGNVCSPFKQLKHALMGVISSDAKVITLGYHSVSMGRVRSFEVEEILLMSHGGAIHDTIVTVERRVS